MPATIPLSHPYGPSVSLCTHKRMYFCIRTGSSSTGLIRHLRSFFTTFGVPEERSWGVRRHRVSSAQFPQSNDRAEVAIKTAKRLLMCNIGPTGSLDHDRFLRAMLQLRNTPDPDCNFSAAQIIFGRPLRDALHSSTAWKNSPISMYAHSREQAWTAKEHALRSRITRTTEYLKGHSRQLRPLALGEGVFLQNQQPYEIGQISDRCRISRPRSIPGKGRWLRTPHVTQSSFPSCPYPSYPIHRAAFYGTTFTA